MPTNTDLVTNLPADFEVFGQAVDSDFADLKGGTSGQILSKNSNTDLDFVWVDNQVGDITSITATTPLTGGGTGGDVTVGIQSASTTQAGAVQLTDSTSSTSTTTAATPNSVKSSYDLANAAIPKSTVTTAGDVLYATGSGTVTRLGIGTAGQVLTVNGGATAPSWASPSGGGGITLLGTATLNNSSSQITFNSISGSYKNLYLVGRALESSSASLDSMYMRVNNVSGTSYGWSSIRAITGGSPTAQGNQDAGEWGSGAFSSFIALSGDGTMYRGDFNIFFPNYSNGDYKAGYYNAGKSGSSYSTNQGRLNFNSTSAISRIDLYINSGSNWKSGSIYLYGEN